MQSQRACCLTTQVYRTLVSHNIAVPKHIIVDRTGLSEGVLEKQAQK